MSEFALPRSLKLKYITRRESDLAALEAAYEAGDIEVFKHLGHQISGNAGSFGFNELEPVGRALEEVTTSNLSSFGLLTLRRLRDWIAEKKRTEGMGATSEEGRPTR